MLTVTKRMEIAGAHCLSLPYESKCKHLHGHNWIVEVSVSSRDNVVNQSGMVVDFTILKKLVKEKLDHRNLNDILSTNPTAENIAMWIADHVNKEASPDGFVSKVIVQESEGNTVCYEPNTK